MRKKFKCNIKGITLVALVVTIIVLLILAGVSIVMITGNNGILTQAQSAKENMKNKSEEEKIKLAVAESRMDDNEQEKLNQSNIKKALDNYFENTETSVIENGNGIFIINIATSGKEYKITPTGIEEKNWKDILKKSQKHSEQKSDKNKNVIGVGTDGNPVNMDLWEYTLLDGKYCLNSQESLNAKENSQWDNVKCGYIGTFENGNIQGTIPRFISIDNGENYIEVNNLSYTFKNCSELINMPELPAYIRVGIGTFEGCNNLTTTKSIPETLENMNSMFMNCKKIAKALDIPSRVRTAINTYRGCAIEYPPKINSCCIKSLNSAFLDCVNLKETPQIPDSVEEMNSTFFGCTSLKKINNIPNKIKDLDNTFFGCTSLGNISVIIPETAITLGTTFYNCTNLSGEITITKVPNRYDYFVGGKTFGNRKLILNVSEEVYNEFSGTDGANGIKYEITDGNPNITMKKIN